MNDEDFLYVFEHAMSHKTEKGRRKGWSTLTKDAKHGVTVVFFKEVEGTFELLTHTESGDYLSDLSEFEAKGLYVLLKEKFEGVEKE